MSEGPLAKPTHLAPATATNRAEWLRTRAASLIALVLGLISFAVVAMTQHAIWSTPDWRISVPGFVVTAIASVISLTRREKAWVFWLCGLGLAGAALVLGWFLMLAVIIGATLIVMLILHAVM